MKLFKINSSLTKTTAVFALEVEPGKYIYHIYISLYIMDVMIFVILQYHDRKMSRYRCGTVTESTGSNMVISKV